MSQTTVMEPSAEKLTSSPTSLRLWIKSIDPVTMVVGFAVYCFCATVFFRHPLLSRFDVIMGNRGDARLTVFLHEHLFNVLKGQAQLASPPFFFPQPDLFRFTDAYFLNALPYSLFRLLGLDPFLSFQIWATVLSLLCFLAVVSICKHYLRMRSAIAICAACLITFPNNLFFKVGMGHFQFFAVYFVPCILWLAFWGIERFPAITPWSIARVGIAASLFALLFATAYYVAWLFAFTLLIAACAAAPQLRGELTTLARSHAKPVSTVAATALICFAIGLIPFALIYVPALSILPGRPFVEYLYYAPMPKDLINVSVWNPTWGWLVERITTNGGEVSLAVTPAMTAIFLLLAYRARKQASTMASMPWEAIFGTVVFAVWAVSWLLTLKIGMHSGYWLIYHSIPGATAIRAGARIQLVVNLWIVLGLTVLLNQWIETATSTGERRRRALLTGGILLVCLVEQVNLFNSGRLSRRYELEWLSAMPWPPPECRSFLVDVRGRPANYIDEFDAMWIAHKTGIPTLNGNSGWIPPGWQLEDPSIDYFDAARRWITLSRIREQACVYDRAARRWSTFR